MHQQREVRCGLPVRRERERDGRPQRGQCAKKRDDGGQRPFVTRGASGPQRSCHETVWPGSTSERGRERQGSPQPFCPPFWRHASACSSPLYRETNAHPNKDPAHFTRFRLAGPYFGAGSRHSPQPHVAPLCQRLTLHRATAPETSMGAGITPRPCEPFPSGETHQRPPANVSLSPS